MFFSFSCEDKTVSYRTQVSFFFSTEDRNRDKDGFDFLVGRIKQFLPSKFSNTVYENEITQYFLN
jgi:hypothetical protein